LGALFLAALAAAHEYKKGELVVDHPWSRATAPGMTMGVGYFVIKNNGKKPERLLGASSPAAESVEIHRTIEEKGMARMRPVAAVDLPPGRTVKAEPGGLHLMLVGLKEPLVAGAMVPLTLRFRDAGEIEVQLKVEAIGATDQLKERDNSKHNHH
jgi:periplasmic copper chaperone A